MEKYHCSEDSVFIAISLYQVFFYRFEQGISLLSLLSFLCNWNSLINYTHEHRTRKTKGVSNYTSVGNIAVKKVAYSPCCSTENRLSPKYFLSFIFLNLSLFVLIFKRNLFIYERLFVIINAIASFLLNFKAFKGSLIIWALQISHLKYLIYVMFDLKLIL